MDFKDSFEKLAAFIPEEERPDIGPILQAFMEEMMNPAIREWGEYQMPLMGHPKLVDFAYNDWKPWENDIVVSSYPKTGTTWLRDVCRHIIYEHDSLEFEFTKALAGPHVYLELGSEAKYELWEKLPWKRRILGTHMSAGMMNLKRLRNSGVKIIYVMRNPKDQMVSMFNMSKNLPFPRENELVRSVLPSDFNDYVQAALDGKQNMFVKKGEGYLDHILTWYAHRNDDNVLLVQYEDMKQNPAPEILKVAKFLGVNMSEDQADKIAAMTSFEATKARMQNLTVVKDFFNKGTVGKWKNHFTVALSERVDQQVEEKLAGTDIKFKYTL
ncbi:sulfotransferase 1C2-like isoform X1 [Ciona intestinalis]